MTDHALLRSRSERDSNMPAQAIRDWVAQSGRQEGHREGRPAAADAALTAAAREGLTRPRREKV